MENLVPFLVLGIILLFGILVFFMIRAEKAEKGRKLQIARDLGFFSVEPDPSLTDRISQLYQHQLGESAFELRNVSRKQIPDGEMYLFDLVNTAGEEDSVTEDQAIAIASQYLNMPEFTIFPKVDIEGFGGKFANSLLQWVVAKVGDPLDFPDHVEFQKRYLVSSADEQGTRQFLDARKLQLLAQVRLLGIHARGDMFILSKFDQVSQTRTRETIGERVSQAMDLYQIFSD